MDRIHMPGQRRFHRERQPASGALEWLLFEVDRLLMTLHVTLCGEGFATINTWKLLLPKVHRVVMHRQIRLKGKHLAT